ncbi:MAG: c-type cytochrome domain-containing protein [Planctomycetaceae bacterium]
MRTSCGFLALIFIALASCVQADVTPEQKEELSAISKKLKEVRTLLKKKQYDDVRVQVAEIESKISAMGLAEDERNRTYKSVMRTLRSLKNGIPVSFEKEIAPILKEKCLRCHGPNRQSARLRMDTFNQMARGGANGPLVRGKSPRTSLLMARLVATDDSLRMPKGGERLPDEELLVISKWISQGANFDGADRDVEIGSKPPEPEKKIVIARPDGTETVSFKKDIAPWLVGSCLGCHGARNPRSGFSMATFEGILRGGDRGDALVPGDADESLIIDLVLRQETKDGERLKMPQGNQRRLKRSQAEMLEKWVNEGAKFDGGDAKAPLRDLVPTAAELEAAKLAEMDTKEFTERRLKQGQDLWERVLPRDEVAHVKSKHTYVFGSDEARATQVSQWAEQDLERVLSVFRFAGKEPWRGRLNIFVANDRFGYEEFNQVVFNRQTPKEMVSHSNVTVGFGEAYVVLEDIGDEVTEASMGLRSSLTAQLVEAFLQRAGNTPPRILSRGAGLWLSQKAADEKDPWFSNLPMRLRGVSIARGTEVFEDGTFSVAELDAAGLSMATFLAKSSEAKYVAFLKSLQSGQTLAEASQRVYKQSPGVIGKAFMGRR